MELTQLRYFKTVSDTKNISEASMILGISQSALTKSIQNLEQELHTDLFERIGKKLVITETGLSLLTYVNNIFTNISYMLSDLQYTFSEQSLRICLAHPSIMAKFPIFEAENPSVSLYAAIRSQTDFKYYLLHDVFDIAITSEQIIDPQITTDILFTDYLWMSVPNTHVLRERQKIRLTDLSGQNISTTSHASAIPLFSRFMKKIEDENIIVHYTIQATSRACVESAKSRNSLYYLSSVDLDTWDWGNERKNIIIDPAEEICVTYYISQLKKRKSSSFDMLTEWLKSITAVGDSLLWN